MNRLGLAVVLASCASDGGPRLDSVEPAAASRGGVVTISGSRLCGTSGDCTNAAGEVLIGLTLPAIQALVQSYADTSVQIMIPQIAPLGPTELVVTVNDHTSNALPFEVTP